MADVAGTAKSLSDEVFALYGRPFISHLGSWNIDHLQNPLYQGTVSGKIVLTPKFYVVLGASVKSIRGEILNYLASLLAVQHP